ncbi:MAG TPA: TonB-dependent receptor [Trichocoleus sp.]
MYLPTGMKSWKLTLALLGLWSLALPARADKAPTIPALEVASQTADSSIGGDRLLSNQSFGLGFSNTLDLDSVNLFLQAPQRQGDIRIRQSADQQSTILDLRPYRSRTEQASAVDTRPQTPFFAEGPENTDPLTPDLPRSYPANSEQIVPQPLLEGPLPSVEDAPRLEVFPVGEPRVPADDRSTIAIAGRILSPTGDLIDQDVVVTLTSSDGEFVTADYDSDRVGFQVLARRGQFQVPLKSSLTAQPVRIRAAVDGWAARGLDQTASAALYPELEAYTQVEFTTYLRPSLVSGIVEFRLGPGGSDFWDGFRNFLNPDQIGTTRADLDAAVFATGAIGEWLFTGAFDSDRALNDRCDHNGLYRDVQFCEQTYPVYGDSSETDFLTPSIDSFYVKFQRDSSQFGAEADYFMWGDYNTFEFSRASQDFTATARQLHGFKGNFSLGPVQLTAMYANNLRPFQRDTIAPDGTSGYYFLSRRLLLPGSEDIFVETVELNRPGTVVERKLLVRGIDYEIDYDRGSLLFRQPILPVDINPLGTSLQRRIVATYQVDGAETGGNLYAGRVQYNFAYGFDQPSWVGATLLSQDEGTQDFTLIGADLLIPLGENGQLIGEIARSSLTSPGVDLQGEAYRLEANGTLFGSVLGRAYLRSAGSGFRNTATTSFRPGQTRWGASITAGLSPTTQVRAQFDRETNTGVTPQVLTTAAALLNPGQEAGPGAVVDNTLNTYNLGLEQKIGTATLGVDWVNRTLSDRIVGINRSAHQIVPRLSVPLGLNLTFNAQSDINLTSDVVPLYPSRTVFGLDWAVEPGVTLRLAQQFVSGGGGILPGSITSLDVLTDYVLGENTSLTSRYSILNGYNGLTGQGAIGLNHRIPIAPGLRATLAFERIFGDAFNTTLTGQQYAQPYAVGYGATALGLQAATSYAVGLEYTDNPAFQASTRFEYRDSSAGSNFLFSAAAAGKVNESITVLGRYQQGNYANQFITDRLGDTIDLKLGAAYRNPASDQFNGLLSYEFRQNPATTPDTILSGVSSGSSDHTLALEGIYAPNWQWEFYGKYAFRYGQTDLANNLGVSSAIHLAQLRAAYRFAYQWDILGEARWIGQPSASYSEVGLAMELGYYLTPDLRLGVGYSFGSANDGSFAGSGYRSASGPYLGITLKVNELLNGFGLQQVAPAQQRESYVEASSPSGVEDSPLEGDPSVTPPGTSSSSDESLPLIDNTPVQGGAQ